METPADPATAAPSLSDRWAGLQKRVISALVLVTVALFCVLAGGMWFIMLVLLASLQMVREWDSLVQNLGGRWKPAGFAYVCLPAISLLWLRHIYIADVPNAGMKLVLFVMFVVWATDIGAYFAGRHFGGPKLAPRLSPNKTWAGLLGGIGAAALMGLLSATFTPYPAGPVNALITGVLLALVSQGGDLFESWLKRQAGVKDSGVLIPGHGGLLDRIDGLVAAAPFYALLVAFSGIV